MRSILRTTLAFALFSGASSVLANTQPDDCMLADQYRVELGFLAHDLAHDGADPEKLPETLLKLSNLDKAAQLHFGRCLQDATINPSFACEVTANARRRIQEASREAKISNMGYHYAADQAHWESVLRNSSPLCPLAFGV